MQLSRYQYASWRSTTSSARLWVGILAKTITGQGFSSAISQITKHPPKYFEDGMQRVHREFDIDHIVNKLFNKISSVYHTRQFK